MKNISLKEIINNIRANIFSKKIDSLLVIDLNSGIKLISVELKGEIKIIAFKSISGNEIKQEEIVKIISDFTKENDILHKNALLIPRLKSLLIKRLKLPAIPEAELPDAIKWQLKEDTSLNLSSCVLDFYIIKEYTKEDGSRFLDIIACLAGEEEIREQVLLLKKLEFNCLAVKPMVFGYAKLLEKCFLAASENIAVLDIAEDNCYFSIHKEGKLQFYRELPLSVNKFRESLKTTLISDKGKIELSPHEIDKILFDGGIQFSSPQIMSMVRPVIERLAQEIKRSLAFYSSQFQEEKTISRIFIAGLATRVPDFEQLLSKELSMDIRKIYLWDKAKITTGIDTKALIQEAGSLGLALDYKEGINLLPREFRTEKIEALQRVSLRWVAIIAFLLLAFSYVFARIGVNAYQKRLNSAQSQLNVLSEIKQIKDRADGFQAFISDIKNSKAQAGLLLKYLSFATGKDIFFDSLSLNWDSKVGYIKGYINSADDQNAILSKFDRDLENSTYFAEVITSSVEKVKTGNENSVKFLMDLKLR